MKPSRKVFRTITRLLTLSAALAALLGVLPWPAAPKYVASASPFVAVCSAIATRSFQLAFLSGLAIVVVCLLWPRWFCRWACPVGLIVEAGNAAIPGRGSNAGIPARGSSAGGEDSQAGMAELPRRRPAVGQWVFWITLGGAAAGYPVLLWLDPLALLAGSAGLRESWAVTAIACAGIALIVLVSLIWSMLWCRRLCPLGAMQDVLAGLRQAAQKAVGKTAGPAAPVPGRAARRAVLASAAALAAGVGVARRAAGASGPLRPPGAIDEERFTGVCIRCGACIRACPAHILKTDLAGSVAGLLAPKLVIAGDYCRENCTRCTEVCPSGAIQPVALARKQSARIGLARVDAATCWLANGRECTVCIRTCPYNAIESVFDEKAWSSRPIVHAEKCNGCGACEIACPVAPTAVRVGAGKPGLAPFFALRGRAL